MTWTIPAATAYSFRQGDWGIGVWSLQKAINPYVTVTVDGVFGKDTARAVTDFQKGTGLTADGVAGPVTQRALVLRIVGVEERQQVMPTGILRGFAEGEGGDLLAAVNHSVPGGIDCGLFQRRVYEVDYRDDFVIERAFDTAYQADLLAKSLVNLRGIFVARAGTNDGYAGMTAREKAWRLAALNHNYPTAADRLSRTPIINLDPYWTTAQSWVTAMGFKFPDGVAVRTPLDWCHLYSGVYGGGKHGTGGSVTRYVKAWP